MTLVHELDNEGHSLHLLSFDYGQRHARELAYARKCAERLGVTYDEIDLSSIGKLLKGSALTDGTVLVAKGHYAYDTMSATVVPNRNTIMLAVAYGIAVSEGSAAVAIGIHSGDHLLYPDCRPEFIEAFEQMEKTATEQDIQLLVPFLHLSKSEIVTIGENLGVPFQDTWSCYEGGDVHCGLCGTCIERREAFELAGIRDPTVYASTGEPG